MAHWAQLDETNKVIQVVVGSNDEPDEGYQSIVNAIGGTWVKTSINTIAGIHKQGGVPLRKNYAGIDYLYDPIRDAFIPPKMECHGEEVILDEDTCQWICTSKNHTTTE